MRVFVLLPGANYEGYGEPIGVYANEELAKAAQDRDNKKSGGFGVACRTPVADRSIEVRHILAARAFERWRVGKLDISRGLEALQAPIPSPRPAQP